MSADYPTVPESCVHCPHLDPFHSTCTHVFRQTIVRYLGEARHRCPPYFALRTAAMRELEERLEFVEHP